MSRFTTLLRALTALPVALPLASLMACGVASELPQSIQLTVAPAGPTAVELTWTDAPELHQGYWLYRDGQQLQTFSQPGTGVISQGLEPESTHLWRVLAFYFPVGGVALSPELSVTTPALAPWTRAALSPEGTLASRPSVALDATGTPRVAYADESAEELVLARRESDGWSYETVAPASGLRSIALVYDTAGRAHVAFVADDGVLRYGRRVPVGWQLEEVAPGPVTACALALDDVGLPQVFHVDAGGGQPELRLARRVGFFWPIEALPGATPVVGEPRALGAPDGLHVAWLAPDGEELALHHASDVTGAWVSGLVATAVRSEPALARAADGTIGVAWLDAASFDVLLSTPVVGGWAAEVVDSLTSVGGGVALCGPPGGGFALTYRNGLDELAHAAGPGGPVEVADYALAPAARVSTAVGADGRVHVAYERADGGLGFASSP